MKKLTFLFLLFALLISSLLQAQSPPRDNGDTLPNFALKNVGNNRIIIGWVNNFTNIKQISIQRSYDSLSGYKTILTVPDPTTPQNGYVDAKATHGRMFYRIYIMLDKGVFLFSNAKRPELDTTFRRSQLPNNGDKFPMIDSVAMPNFNNNKPKSTTFLPSLHVYTNRDGYVRISLPGDEKSKKYSIKFFDNDETFLFEIKEVKEKDFKIDKTNFYHAGWFRFELYEDEKLIEKHKFYLEKDFTPVP
ncbi:MAG: hypothetical protein SGI83_04580 [Bacteroidota bacterium]|nr:hypothetical protein [Bacteroidota bacterium]